MDGFNAGAKFVSLPFAFMFAAVTASVSVWAFIPPRCGYSVAAGTLTAWCNADEWAVVARQSDGDETVVMRGHGVGGATLPTRLGETYRIDLNY